MLEKNIITAKINNKIIGFERSEASNDILIEFIHVEAGAKRSKKISFSHSNHIPGYF